MPFRIMWPRRRLWLALALAVQFGWAAPSWAQEQEDAAYQAYERGDYAAALSVWQVQAEKGSADAQYNIGILYDLGRGVEQDKAKAVRWYRQAAIRGLAAAQFNLALMLMNGEGVDRAPIRAHMLFDLAADSDPEAAVKRDRLAVTMTPGQIAEAARLARLARGGGTQLIREILTGIFPDDEYSPAQLARIEAELAAPVQRALIALGYDPGPADGAPGPATRTAVRAYQTDAGREADGRITQELLTRLQNTLDRQLAGQELPYGQGRFWRIEVPGAKPSHILGTMHSNDPRVLNLPEPIRAVFRRASSVTMELNFKGGRAKEQQLARTMSEALLLTDGRTLDQIVGEDRFADIAAAFRPFGVPAESLKRLKPWAIYYLLTVSPGRMANADSGEPFLDVSLAQEAESRGTVVYGLEKPEEQLDVFAGMSEVDQVALLESSIGYAAEQGLGQETLIRLYLAGDLAAIFRLMVEPARLLGEDYMTTFIERLLDARNEVMVHRMDGLLKHGNAFIGVGAAHLPGDKGVLHLLEKKGYKITRVY